MSEGDTQQESLMMEDQGVEEKQNQAVEGSAVVEEPGIAAEAGLADLADAYAGTITGADDNAGEEAAGDATHEGEHQSRDQQQDEADDANVAEGNVSEDLKPEEQTEKGNDSAAETEQPAITDMDEKSQDVEASELKPSVVDTVSQDVGDAQAVVPNDVEEQVQSTVSETNNEQPTAEAIDSQIEQPATDDKANSCTQEQATTDEQPCSETAAVTEPSGPPALYQGFGIEPTKDEQGKESEQPAKEDKIQRDGPPKSVSQKTVNATAKKTSPSKKAAPVEVVEPDTIKAHHPWLDGTFRTPKGRVVTAKELCESIDKMTRAYAKKLGADEDGSPAPPEKPSQYNTKVLSTDEVEAVVSRLYTSKSAADAAEAGQLERVTLKFDEQGKEQWVPVKKADPDENREYMCALYERCLEQRKKTEEELATKYLQPLGKPRKVAC